MKYTTAFVVSLTLLVSTFAALAQEKGAEYTLVVPLGLVQYDGCDWSCNNSIYGVEVHDESGWGINFAHVETTSFEKISDRSRRNSARLSWRKHAKHQDSRLTTAPSALACGG